jgi:chitodextrinase/glucose/arabinose dehydrogenase
LFSPWALAQTFNDDLVSGSWNAAVGFTFDATGRMYVWEKGGKVYCLVNGQKRLFLDISEEVGNFHDYGLLGFCLDPRFRQNGYVYLSYVVDRHHLITDGKPERGYSSTTNTYFAATIGRITRYTAKAGTDFTEADPASRKILVGETKKTGFPILHQSHGPGSLFFGTDGSLLAAFGDAASYDRVDAGSAPGTYYAQAGVTGDSIILNDENIGAYRSQYLNSHNGKILRLDPATGDGLPSNPNYDPAQPRSPRSRVYALGFRNPFRTALRPNTGSHNLSDGNPGVLFVGDVGWNNREELNVVTAPNQNFGWPKYEGMTHQPGYNDASKLPANFDQVFVKPRVDYRTGSARAWVNGASKTIGSASGNVPGPTFGGQASTAGCWYTGTNFPTEYRNTYLHTDYAGGWIRSFQFDADYNLLAVRDVKTGLGNVTFVGMNPDGELYYLRYTGTTTTEIRRLRWGGNRVPTAVASANKTYGPSPLVVAFRGDQSSDPDGSALSYEWNFGDGSPVSTQANPSKTFTVSGIQKYTVTLKVTDPQGASHTTSLVISPNNMPPRIVSTSLDGVSTFPNQGLFTQPLNAVVQDSTHAANQLSYEWQVTLHHDDHTHPEPVNTNASTSAVLATVPCDDHVYFYRITLKVTDAGGLTATAQKDIQPNCQVADTQAPTAPMNLGANAITQTGFNLTWTASTDNVGVAGYDVYQGTTLLGATASLTYAVGGLLAGTTYSFTVKARDAAGNASVASPTLTVTTAQVADTQAPTAPTDLTSSNVGQTGLSLNWTASTDNVGVTGYEIYRGTDKIGESTTNSFNVTGLTASTAYAFTVKAKDAAGNVSPASSTHSVTTTACQPTVAYLSDLTWVSTTGTVQKAKSGGGQALVVGGETYAKGLGMIATSEVVYQLDGNWSKFRAYIGLDDEVGNLGSARYEIWADGNRLWESSVLGGDFNGVPIEVDVTGKAQLRLVISDGGDGAANDHADWADARLENSCPAPPPPPPGECVPSAYLSDLTWTSASNGTGPVEKDKSNGGAAAGDGGPLRLGTNTYAKGLGVSARSEIVYNLGGLWKRFKASIGVDEEVGNAGSVQFQVWADGGRLWQSSVVGGDFDGAAIDIDVTGKQELRLIVTNGGDDNINDHANWADARLERICGTPDTLAPSAPTGLVAANLTNLGLTLTWTASTDNVGVTGYEIYRGTDKIGESTTTSFTVSGLEATTAYAFTVKAKDAAGNTSPSSATLNVTTPACAPATAYLSDLTWVSATNGTGPVEKNRSNGGAVAGDGGTLTMGGETFAKGLGVSAASEIVYRLEGQWSKFKANIGVDDEVGNAGSVQFQVWADGQRIWQSSVLGGDFGNAPIEIDVAGKLELKLIVSDGGDGNANDHANWADARLERTCPAPPPPPPGACEPVVYLSDLTWTSASNGTGPVEKDKSNGGAAAGDGGPLRLGTNTYAKGLGVSARSEIVYNLGGLWTSFKADVGLDEEVSNLGSVRFEVWADGGRIWQSSVLGGDFGGASVEFDVTGKQELRLVVTNGGDDNANDHANWADARLERTCPTGGGTRLSAPVASSTALNRELGPPLRVYPNPARKHVLVSVFDSYRGPIRLDLMNTLGVPVHTEQAEKDAPAFDRDLRVEHLPAGVYLLRVLEGEVVRTQRLVVQP